MSFTLLSRIPPLRWALYRLARWRVEEKLRDITPDLKPGDRILDLGSGNCVLVEQLRARGFDVQPVDLANLSFIPGIAPVLYDGRTLPFPDNSFDVALVITVLHHTRDPDAVLAEVRRKARRLVVIEEIFENSAEKYATFAIDSLFNLEFFGHPRTNRTDAGWRDAFRALGLSVDSARYSRSLGVLRRVYYVLSRAAPAANATPPAA
jgi:ubiquinone/menaquinone biosynthesis C-methylase UbiE